MKKLIPLLVLLLIAAANAIIWMPLNSAEGNPDLTIIGLDTLPNPPVAGQNYDAYVWVKNIGNATFNGTLMIELGTDTGSSRIQEIDGVRLASGEEKKFTISRVPPFPEPGQKMIYARVTSPTVEANSNDRYSKVVTVLPGAAGPGSEVGSNGIVGSGGSQPNPVIGEGGDALSGGAKGGLSRLQVIAVILVIIIIIIIAVVYLIRRKNAPVPQGPQMVLTDTVEIELDSLRKEKEELEEAINIAKIKFYKRQMDEDSYKEIVKDHQEKLTRIEARMAGIEKRVTRLEKVNGRPPNKNLE